MSSNLPPGVNPADIPGNGPEDEEWDRLYDWLAGTGLTPHEIREAVRVASAATKADEVDVPVGQSPKDPWAVEQVEREKHGVDPAGEHACEVAATLSCLCGRLHVIRKWMLPDMEHVAYSAGFDWATDMYAVPEPSPDDRELEKKAGWDRYREGQAAVNGQSPEADGAGVPITAISLEGDGSDLLVLAKHRGQWFEVIREHSGHAEVVPICHVVHEAGLKAVVSRSEVECGATRRGYYCTEPLGHDGEHVARDNKDHICLAWPGEGPADPGPECYATSEGFYCTEPKGHAGDHVAKSTSNRVCHRWPQDGGDT